MTTNPTGDSREGYPYECTETYRPSSHQRGTTTIHRGTQGKVVVVERNVAFVTMIFHDPERRRISDPFRKGWVPLRCIQVSTRRKYGDLEYQVASFAPIVTPTGAPGPHLGQNSQLRRAYECLFASLNDNRNLLGFARRDIMDRIVSPSNRAMLVNIIMAGIPPPVSNVLNRSNFTVLQLRDALASVENNEHSTGVYTIIYWFTNNTATHAVHYKKPEQYIGKSVNLAQRNNQHLQASRASGNLSSHYKSAQEAGQNRKMGVLCYLNGQDNATLLAVEQANMLLFDTYLPAVKNLTTAEADGDNLATDAAKYHNDKEEANKLTGIAQTSFQRSQWPIARRQSGTPSYGAGPGKNWQSPISDHESWDRIQWIKQPLPEAKMSLYWRKELKATRTGPGGQRSQLHVFFEPSTAPGKVTEGRFSVSLGLDPPPDTVVYPVIELMDDNRVHPLHYSRLPDVGCWTDWDEARSFAVRVEWCDNQNQQRYRYVYASQVFHKRPGHSEVVGGFTIYGHCLAIARHLKQQRLDSRTLPAFIYNYGVMRLKQQSYHHMNQIMRYVDVPAPPPQTFSQSPTLRSLGDVQSDLGRIGLNVGGPRGVFDWMPVPTALTRFPAGACDSCHLLNVRQRDPPAAGLVPALQIFVDHPKTVIHPCVTVRNPPGRTGPETCEMCLKLGRVCSWTSGIHFVRLDDRLVTALLPLEPTTQGNVPMADPGLGRVEPGTAAATYF